MSHARLGCSNHRWPACPGSIREEADYPDTSGPAAIDGTGTHILVEDCVNTGKQAADFIGEQIGVGHPDKPQGWTVDSERAERVQMCLDYLARRKFELSLQFPDGKLVVETESKADPGGMFGRDDWWGTVDLTLMVLNPSGGLHFLEIIDYKDGRGWVNEKDNTQLLSYCGGKMRPYVGSGPELVRPFRTERIGGCRMAIVQPKTSPAVRYWDATSLQVMDALIEIAESASKTDDPDAPLVPGKHCQWCKANPKRGGLCTALIKEVSMGTELSNFEFIEKAVADPKALDSDKLAQLMAAKAPLMTAFDKIEAELHERLELGEEISGFALKPGRGSSVWNDSEEEIVKKLKGKRLVQDDYYPKKLASPAQILSNDKLSETQKRKLEEELVTFKAGKLKVTKVAEKEKSADMMFAQVKPKEISFM